MTPEQMEFIFRIESIFMPVARQQRDIFYKRQVPALNADPARFVHYTTADAALKIINSKRMWMRNAMSMVDFREVQHGFEILQKYFADPASKAAFVAALDASVPGAAHEALNLFDQHWSNTRLHTYIASISEHDATEDKHGRLSMWRGFGGTAPRIAIVLKVAWEPTHGAALSLLFSPVAYLTEDEIYKTIQQVMKNVSDASGFLRGCDRKIIVSNVLQMLLAAVTCLKHEGFREEREWRAIYSPFRMPSPLMLPSTQVIGGIPQVVYSIPLDETVSPLLAGLDFPRIFDRLIIGPTPYAFPIAEALIAALKQAGVPPDVAEQKVFISGIPIRA
jgi:hypothetical protein